MINLPKPSSLRTKGTADEKISYLVSYINTLVTATEKALQQNYGFKSETTNVINALSYTQDGICITRADGSVQTIKSNTVLWSGAHYMSSSQTAVLSEKISSQTKGIVVVFSAYADSKAQDYQFQEFFIPKKSVALKNGVGYNFPLFTTVFDTIGNKYLYISDNQITGHDNNTSKGSANGITYNNKHWVLRYVIGV